MAAEWLGHGSGENGSGGVKGTRVVAGFREFPQTLPELGRF